MPLSNYKVGYNIYDSTSTEPLTSLKQSTFTLTLQFISANSFSFNLTDPNLISHVPTLYCLSNFPTSPQEFDLSMP